MTKRQTGAMIELPRDFGDRVQTLFGFDQRPETFGDWGAWMTQAYEKGLDRTLTPEDLCLVDSSNHQAQIGDTLYNYQCALDAFVVGYLIDEPVTIQSTPPTSDTTITVEFDDGEVRADPEGIVLSFGIAENVEPTEGATTPEQMYGYICPYSHAFPSQMEYEEWARNTDAVTITTDLIDGLEIARELLNLWKLGESN